MKSIWQYRGDIKAKPSSQLVEAAEGSLLIAKLLMNRGLTTPEGIREFLNLDDYEPVSGLELPDMDKAVRRIQRAIERQEHILIYGDFDVDGITGTAILYEALSFLGANVSYYIPDRAKEGHGLNTAACLRLVSARKVKLVVTTDTGITNFTEINLLNGLGVDTIVTDHHELPDNLPPSLANVNPKLLPDQNHPLSVLCGAGVAFKLCELLLDAASEAVSVSSEGLQNVDLPSFTQEPAGVSQAMSEVAKPCPITPQDAERVKVRLLDLTAIGTVADLASLLKENRYLVCQGVKVLNARQRLGVRAILEQAGTSPEATLTSETVGFTIGPRLNALGRLENATQAVELLTTQDPQRAEQLAMRLEQLNRRRRELCDQIFMEADRHVQLQGGLDGRRAVALASPDWHLGVIGIVASRLIEKYHVPVFMMVVDEDKGVARCSARSIPGFHLHDELVPLSDMFEAFGGHAGAGGFTLPLPKLNLFKERIHEIAARKITDEQMLPIVEVDDKLDWSQINPHLVGLLARMAPFGMDNPAPKFVLENAAISAQRTIGEGERHLKLMLTNPADKNSPPLEALCWNFMGKCGRLDTQEAYRFVVSPELNTYNNTTKVQLIIDDVKPMSAQVGHITTAASNVLPGSRQEQPAPGVMAAVDKPPVLRPDPLPPRTSISELPSHTEQDSVASKSSLQTSENASGSWIDHRGREALDAFVGQLMMPLQDRSVVIYHEGRKPEIPFLKDSLLATRLTVSPAEELILWDLPPSREIFSHVLQSVQPRRVHYVGGKYQSVPVFQPEKNYLNLLVQMLKKEAADAAYAMQINVFAAQLGISAEVTYHGLILLEKLGYVNIVVNTVSDSVNASQGIIHPAQLTLQVQLLHQRASQKQASIPVSSHLEYHVFRQAVQEMAAFRNWLLSDPLDTIKSAFTQVSMSSWAISLPALTR